MFREYCCEWMQNMGKHGLVKIMFWMRCNEAHLQVYTEFPWGLVLHWHGYGGFCMVVLPFCDLKRVQKILPVGHSSRIQLCEWLKASLQILCKILFIYAWWCQEQKEFLVLDTANSTHHTTNEFPSDFLAHMLCGKLRNELLELTFIVGHLTAAWYRNHV
jgi:hypothetical protein